MRFAVMVVQDLVGYLVLGARCAWSVLRETLPDSREEGDAFLSGFVFMVVVGWASLLAVLVGQWGAR